MDDQATGQRRRVRTRYANRSCGGGCGGFIFVLTVGIVLSLFNAGIGIGVSLRIPFTQSNLTVAGSVGEKSKVVEALPSYTQGGSAATRTSSTTRRP